MSMPEPRPDMFPDPSQTTQGASESVTTQVQTDVVSEEQQQQTATQKPPGTHTPDNQLYAALKEEREKRKTLEARLEALESNPQSSVPSYTTDDIYSDEGKIILQQIEPLKKTISSLQEQLSLKDLVSSYPELQGKEIELKEYAKEYPGVNIEKVAKLFLQENGISLIKERRGLESPSGGTKTPNPKKMSQEDIERIRTNQPRLYLKMIKDGSLNVEE